MVTIGLRGGPAGDMAKVSVEIFDQAVRWRRGVGPLWPGLVVRSGPRREEEESHERVQPMRMVQSY